MTESFIATSTMSTKNCETRTGSSILNTFECQKKDLTISLASCGTRCFTSVSLPDGHFILFYKSNFRLGKRPQGRKSQEEISGLGQNYFFNKRKFVRKSCTIRKRKIPKKKHHNHKKFSIPFKHVVYTNMCISL